jgi:hypothetical protein
VLGARVVVVVLAEVGLLEEQEILGPRGRVLRDREDVRELSAILLV